jgi:hypothetical protein
VSRNSLLCVDLILYTRVVRWLGRVAIDGIPLVATQPDPMETDQGQLLEHAFSFAEAMKVYKVCLIDWAWTRLLEIEHKC